MPGANWARLFWMCIFLQTRQATSDKTRCYLTSCSPGGHHCTFSLCLSLRSNWSSCRSRAGCFLVDPTQKQIFPMQKARKGRKGLLFGTTKQCSLLSEGKKGSELWKHDVPATLQFEGFTAASCLPYGSMKARVIILPHPPTCSTLHCRVWAVEAALAVSSHISCSKACTGYICILWKEEAVFWPLTRFLPQASCTRTKNIW